MIAEKLQRTGTFKAGETSSTEHANGQRDNAGLYFATGHANADVEHNLFGNAAIKVGAALEGGKVIVVFRPAATVDAHRVTVAMPPYLCQSRRWRSSGQPFVPCSNSLGRRLMAMCSPLSPTRAVFSSRTTW